MTIKSSLIDYLKRVAKDTPEVDIRKDILPSVKQKDIRDIPLHALLVGCFLKLLLNSLPSLVLADPKLQKIKSLHNTLQKTYETKTRRNYMHDLRLIPYEVDKTPVKKNSPDL